MAKDTVLCTEKCKFEHKVGKDAIQCMLCMEWCHIQCVGILKKQQTSAFSCPNCRAMPTQVAQLVKSVADLQKMLIKNNDDVMLKLREKEDECKRLTNENVGLRLQVADLTRATNADAWQSFRTNNNVNNAEKSETLVIGDSIVRSLNEKALKLTKVKAFPGGKIKDVIDEITVDTKYQKVVIVAGTNEISDMTDAKDVVALFDGLIKETKKHATDIVVSSILPRTDIPAVEESIAELNSELHKLCQLDEDVQFIDNDCTFRLRDGSVNCGFLHDGLHLTKEGTRSLAKNLGLQSCNEQEMYCRPYCGTSKLLTAETSNNKGADVYPAPNQRRIPQHRYQSRSYNNTLNSRRYTRDGPTCWHCGEGNHLQKDCRHAAPLTCRLCGRQGHKEKCCWRYN